MTKSKPIRLLIVDDHPVVRAGLFSMLASYANLDVLGGMASGMAALAFLKKRRADIVLLDLRMAEMSGLETLEAIKNLESPPKVIVLTSFETDDDISRTILAGADGYLLKASSDSEILTAIETVHSGGRYLPVYIALRFAECAPRAGLSASEKELLDLLARGLNQTEIEAILQTGKDTLWEHFNRLVDHLRKEGMPENYPNTAKGRVTIEELARRAGVSISTASRVLNNKGGHSDETRSAVLRAAKAIGFEPNRAAASLATLRARLTAKRN